MTCSPIAICASLVIIIATFPVNFAKPTCIDVTSCHLLGTPEEEEKAFPVAQLDGGCHDGPWTVSLYYTHYMQSSEETFLIYKITQLGADTPEKVTISWTGNCCVREASSAGTSIEYGLNELGNSFGVTFAREVLEAPKETSFYTVVYAGDLPSVPDAATVTIGGDLGHCVYSAPGPDCSQCQESCG